MHPDSLIGIQPRYGASLVTALARLGGRAVAILANNPAVGAGAVDAAAAERAGTLRHAARMFMAQHRRRVPKLHVTMRKAFGFGWSIMAMNPFDGQTLSLAFPAATLGAMPAASGAAVAKLDADTRARLAAGHSGSALQVASRLGFDEVIDPRELRNALLQGLMLARARETLPGLPSTPR